MADLFRVKAPFTAVGTELGGVKGSGLQYDRELVGSTPAFRVLVGCRHHLPLQPPGFPPFVEGDHMDAQLL